MEVVHAAKSLIGHLLRPVHAGADKLASHLPGDSGVHAITVRSSVFSTGGAIPKRYSQDGENMSPPLNWSGVPADARELVLICEDPDAPMAQPFIHWVLFGLSHSTSSLPEHVAPLESLSVGGPARQGLNSAKKIGYVGPKPPIGHGVHHYHFQLFALNAPSGLGNHPDRDAITNALAGKVIAMGELVGTYERR